MKFVSFIFSEYIFSSLALHHYQQTCTVPWRSHFKDTNIAPLPASLGCTSIEFLYLPLCIGIFSLLLPLFIYFIQDCASTLIYFMGRRGSLLIESMRGYPSIEAYIRSLILVHSFIFPPFPSLLDQISLKTPKHKNSSVGMRFPAQTWISLFNTRIS